MEFKAAVKALGAAYTQRDIADALGVSWHTVKQASLPADSSGHRSPPDGWRPKLARLARKRAGDLTELAHRLENVQG